jgi:hypothetical protein
VVIGITSACETSGALALFRWKTIMVSSGVSMPEIGLMSAALTARLTGGAYLTPGLVWTVTVLLSEEISGAPAARSSTGFSGCRA